MPETFRSFPVAEVAIALRSKPDLIGGSRIQEGDIVAVRMADNHASRGIGLKEDKLYLWIRIEGWDLNDFSRLTAKTKEPPDDFDQLEPPGGTEPTPYDKRRYCIPLERLKIVMPSLDMEKARDLGVAHQPGLPFDTDGPFNHLEGTEMRPLNIEGLIFDKTIGDFVSTAPAVLG